MIYPAGQPVSATLNLVQQGSLLTGTVVTAICTWEIKDGKVSADGISFSGPFDPQGSKENFFGIGTVTGTQISGTLVPPTGSGDSDSPQRAAPLS